MAIGKNEQNQSTKKVTPAPIAQAAEAL